MKYRLVILSHNYISKEEVELVKIFEAENPDEVTTKAQEQLKYCQDLALSMVRKQMCKMSDEAFSQVERMVRKSFKIARVEECYE